MHFVWFLNLNHNCQFSIHLLPESEFLSFEKVVMSYTLFKRDDYVRAVIDAVPSAVFVVNQDFQIFDLNPAAKKLFGIFPDVILRRLCGETMNCMHAINSEEGCGSTEYCPDCVIRNSVEASFIGNAVHIKKYRMKIQKDSNISDIYMLRHYCTFLLWRWRAGIINIGRYYRRCNS